MGRGLGLGCLALTLIVSLRARAQEAEEQSEEVGSAETEPSEEEVAARAHFAAGRNHFERGRYELALAEFEAAHELTQAPDLWYNIYLAHERLGNLEAAANALEQYLPHSGASQATLTARLESIRARLEEQREAARAEEARRAEQERLRRAEAQRAAQDGGVSAGAVAGLVAGGVGLVTFGVFAILSAAEDGDLAETCGRDAGRFCSADDVSQLETYNLVADIGLAVGVAGAAVGVVFLLLGGGDTGEEAPPVAAWISRDGGGVALREAF